MDDVDRLMVDGDVECASRGGAEDLIKGKKKEEERLKSLKSEIQISG